MNKRCSKCSVVKDIASFCKKRSNKDGLYIWCRTCCAEHKAANKESIAIKKKAWVENNRDKVRIASNKWYLSNKVKKHAYTRARYNSNIHARLSSNLRSRLSKALKNNQKLGSAIKDLGCSIEELRKHLESKWKLGMSWDNYGHKPENWNIDHVVPLSSFDLTDREQLLKACHYSNLQPLWATENYSKSNKNV